MLTSSPTHSSRLVTWPLSSYVARGHSSPVAGSSTATPGNGWPSEPGGVPSTRLTMTAFSVEPKPSTTTHPNRRANSWVSRSPASLPNTIRSGLSASSGSSGVART